MSIADQIINKTYNNKVSNNSTSKNSSIANSIIDGRFSEYKKKQEQEEKKRKQEEERKKEEQKRQEEINVNDFFSKTNNSSLEELQKNYEELSLKERTNIMKKAQEESNTSIGKLNLSEEFQKNNSLKNINKDNTTESNSLKEKAKNASKVVENLDLSIYDAILQAGKWGAKLVDNARPDYLKTSDSLAEQIINSNKKSEENLIEKLDNDKDFQDFKQKYKNATVEELEEHLKGKNAVTDSRLINPNDYVKTNGLINENDIILPKANVNDNNLIQKEINKTNAQIQDNIEGVVNSPTSKKLAELTGGMGSTVAGMGVSMLNPLVGTAFFTASASGSYYDEAKQRGMNDNQSMMYAGIMGAMEGLTEKYISAERIGSLKTILEGTSMKNALKSFGIEVGENFIQEAVMPSISEATALVTGGKDSLNYDFSKKEDWKDLLKNSWQDGVDGALSAILIGGATRGIASCVNVADNIRNGRNVTDEEIKLALKEAQQSGVDVETILKNNIKDSLAQAVSQQELNQNNNIPQLNDILNNKELPMQNYKYEKSNNSKIDNLRKDASKYFNNSKEAHNYIQMLEQIINDKNIDIKLDADLKTSDGKFANGSYSNGVITINPNSTRTGEFIAIHELTHAIGTEQMINIIENYKNSNMEFNTEIKKLLKNYENSEITEEAMSDIAGQLFGNQEFINNLSKKNPNIFKKIYSEIKYLWHQFKGYKNQNQFIEDLQYKWTQAYNSNNKLNTQNSYAIETNDKGYKYVRADRQVISGNNPEVWKEQAKNYIDEKIRNNKDVKVYAQDGTELTITRNTSGKATFRNEVRQADGTIRKLTDEEFASKLRAETHIDELGQISTHKNGPVADTKNHDFAKDGFTYRNAYFEDIDGQYYKITMSVGKNGDINTIYNVGKMQQAQKNRSNSTNRGFKDPNGNNTASSRISSINSITNSNEDVNTTTKYSMQESENNSKTETENGNDIMPFEKKELIEFTKNQEEELTYWISQKEKLEKVKETLKYEDLRKFSEHWASEYKNNIDGFIKEYYEELRDRIQENLQNNEKFIKGAKKLIDIAEKENLIISKSPYGDSYYAHKSNEGIDWGTKPEGSYRLSDHWNWGGRRALCYGY